MEKKIECEIVQDLLLGYIDDTLNKKSKELVEKHLNECEICREKLQDIKNDIEENQNNQKKEIDYLKKIRIKSKIKAIFIAIGILTLLVVIFYFNKFITITSIMNKASRSLESQNYYSESQQILSNEETLVSKIYYKDGKYKEVNEIYSDDGVSTWYTIYGEVGTDKRIQINEENKHVTITTGDVSKMCNEEDTIKWCRFGEKERNSVFLNLGKTFLMSITTDNYGSNKEYYVLKNQFGSNKNKGEIWIDKETGLVIKDIQKDSQIIFFAGTDVVKEIRDCNISYKYAFDIVTDEDVTIPDYSEYEIEYVDEIDLDSIK